MAKRKKQLKQKKKKNTRYLIAITLVIGAIIILGFVFRQQTEQSAAGNETILRDSDTAFSFSTLAGQLAPEFTAIGVDGQPYTVTPGDGRAKAIIFYMGFQ